MRPVRVLPSLLSCDFAHLAEQIEFCRSCGAKELHVDVMDGHFVPNLTIGPLLVAAMRRSTDLLLDVHLMMSRPLPYLQAFRDAGADRIYVHVEAIGPRQIDTALDAIAATGAEPALAFNPDTDPLMWTEALARCRVAMLMTVYPGFGGQSFIPAVRPRLRALRQACPHLSIQVDGGIDRQTAPLVASDGADRLVCGSAFFQAEDPAAFLRHCQALTAT